MWHLVRLNVKIHCKLLDAMIFLTSGLWIFFHLIFIGLCDQFWKFYLYAARITGVTLAISVNSKIKLKFKVKLMIFFCIFERESKQCLFMWKLVSYSHICCCGLFWINNFKQGSPEVAQELRKLCIGPPYVKWCVYMSI